MLQYTAVGIQNESRMAVTRDEYWIDLKNLAGSIVYGVWNCSLDLPVRLVAVSERGIGGCCLGGSCACWGGEGACLLKPAFGSYP